MSKIPFNALIKKTFYPGSAKKECGRVIPAIYNQVLSKLCGIKPFQLKVTGQARVAYGPYSWVELTKVK